MSLLTLTSALLLALPAAVASSSASLDAIRSAAGRTGSVAGVVRVTPAPARRTAERYAGVVPVAERAVQEVPAVVYLKGASLSAAAPSPRPRLMQKDTMFAPAAVVIPVGTVLEFPNADPFFHNVFSYSKARRFDLGRYPRGESKSIRFDAAGTVKIYCEVHRSMRAVVVVVESPYYAVVDGGGRFSIADVEPGPYELVVVDAERGTRTMAVTVAGGRTANVAISFP